MNGRKPLAVACVLTAALGVHSPAEGRQGAARPATAQQPPSQTHAIGIDVFGGAGLTWPAAADSFDAVGLGERATEFGGGARVTGVWRDLFAQATAYRWGDSGERAFVDSAGTVFPLGIPLDVKATYLDASVGWKSPMITATGRTAMWSYVAAGAGLVMYKEESPFAEEGENIDTRSVSYHVLAGVEIPVVNGLAVAIDGRYRFVPGLLGEDGVSSVHEEDILGGFQASVGLRVGFGAASRPRVAAPPAAPPPPRPLESPAQLPRRLETGVLIEAAPVFLQPDTRRTPLRTLTAGTPVRILDEKGEWLRVEFTDNLGARVGYVQRKFVQIQ